MYGTKPSGARLTSLPDRARCAAPSRLTPRCGAVDAPSAGAADVRQRALGRVHFVIRDVRRG